LRNPALNVPGVVAALALEARLLGPARRHGAVLALADGTLLTVSGIGPAAAAQAARRLIDAGATALVSFGVAGGLDPALAAGTLLLPGEVISPDGTAHPTALEWRARVGAAIAARHPVSEGRLLTCSTPLGSAAEKARAFRQTAAVAVDTESLAVAEVAARSGVPFLVVRAIVDAAGDTLPRTLLAIAAATGAVPIGQLAGSLLRAPRDLPGVVRLARRYRAARRALVAVARSGALASATREQAAGLP
jgi:adenosylhomocysteine nucleosidase